MDSSRQIAEAMKVREVRQTIEGAAMPKMTDPRRTMVPTGTIWPRQGGQACFVDSPKRKVLCACGAIAEVDLRMAATKMGLGKVVECRTCRNERVAREREELERQYSGDVDPEDDPC